MNSLITNDYQQWIDRWERLRRRVKIRTDDFKREIKWTFMGGKRFFERYSFQNVNSHKWCFIVGCNNSGTSLLQAVLESSAEVSTMPHEGQRYTCVLTRGHRRGFERVFTEFLEDIRMTEKDDVSCAPRLIHDWMEELQPPFREIIVEKTTLNALRMRWLQKVFPRSYFIAVIRNGYAVVEGIRRKGNRSVERGARHWNKLNKIMKDDSTMINNILFIHYEDLVGNTYYVTQKIEKFLGLTPNVLCNAANQQYSLPTIFGKKNIPIRDFNAESIKRLESSDINKIRAEASEMLDYFQYSPNS